MTIEERLKRVRQDVDEVLRALVETGGTPPLLPPSPRPAGTIGGCAHTFVSMGFGSTQDRCNKCGATK